MSWVDDIGNVIEDAVSNAARTAGDAAKKVVEVQVAIATEPTEILVDPATGQPLDQSAKDLVTAVADGTTAVATQATIPDVFMIDLASGVAGDAGTKIADVATAGRTYSIDIRAAMPALLNKPTPPTPAEVAAGAAHDRVRLQVRRAGRWHARIQQLQQRRPARHRHAEGEREGGRHEADGAHAADDPAMGRELRHRLRHADGRERRRLPAAVPADRQASQADDPSGPAEAVARGHQEARGRDEGKGEG
jgi:hypothetical protein